MSLLRCTYQALCYRVRSKQITIEHKCIKYVYGYMFRPYRGIIMLNFRTYYKKYGRYLWWLPVGSKHVTVCSGYGVYDPTKASWGYRFNLNVILLTETLRYINF
jgi:hypothetical protein